MVYVGGRGKDVGDAIPELHAANGRGEMDERPAKMWPCTVGILVPRAGRGDWLIWHALRRLTGSPQHVPQSIRSAGLRKREMRRASDLPRAGEVLLACDDTRESRAFPRLTLPDGWCASPEDETWKLSTRA